MNLPKVNNLFYKVKIAFFIFLIGIILILSIYYALNSLSGLQENLFTWLKSIIYDENNSFGIFPKLLLFLKFLNIILFFTLTLVFYVIFSSGLSFLFYIILAEKHNYKRINLVQSFKKAFKWQLYGYYYTFFPIITFVLATMFFLFLSALFFKPIMAIVGINTGIFTFVSIFPSFLNVSFVRYFLKSSCI